jgi:hypothetical protein
MSSKIERIRAACSIGWAWKILGLPGSPNRTCKSPFREDKKPSFSVYMSASGERWYDQAEGVGGDVVDFWAKAREVTVQAAVEQLGNMIGEAKPPTAKYIPAEEKLIDWPDDLCRPTVMECVSLSMLRNLPSGCFDLAANLGFLKVGTHKGELLWFLTDASRRGAEGKTFTGEMCAASGKKTAALPGTSKSWCYGLISDRPEWNAMKKIVVVEGLPDFFAALALLIDCPSNARVISMLGASTKPGDECRKYVRDREFLIIGHNDKDGIKAREVWRKRLQEMGADKVIVQDLPEGYKDLCEFVSANPPDQTLHVLKGFSS